MTGLHVHALRTATGVALLQGALAHPYLRGFTYRRTGLIVVQLLQTNLHIETAAETNIECVCQCLCTCTLSA